MKILILTCNTGGGHTSCAKYIEEELKLNNISCEVINFLDFIGENTTKVIEKVYLDSIKGKGNIFKGVYKIGEIYNKSNIKSPVYLFNKLAKNNLQEYIVKNNFDLMICTHLFPSMTLTELKKESDIKFINVATDYECIPFWNETKPNKFVIPSSLLKKKFIEKGILEDVLLPIGIPVSSTFKKINNNLKLPRNFILLTSGSMGFGEVKDLVELILKEIDNYYLIVVCGKNKKLESELKKINNPFLIIVGYTKDMNEYIKKSKIVITKPGGLTTTEIAVLHKPFIHMMPIPGVENYNASFFSDNKMSLKATNKIEVIESIKELINDKNLQKELVSNQKKIINDNSAADLVEYIKENF